MNAGNEFLIGFWGIAYKGVNSLLLEIRYKGRIQ